MTLDGNKSLFHISLIFKIFFPFKVGASLSFLLSHSVCCFVSLNIAHSIKLHCQVWNPLVGKPVTNVISHVNLIICLIPLRTVTFHCFFIVFTSVFGCNGTVKVNILLSSSNCFRLRGSRHLSCWELSTSSVPSFCVRVNEYQCVVPQEVIIWV